MDRRIPIGAAALCIFFIAAYWAVKAHDLTAMTNRWNAEKLSREQARQNAVAQEQARLAAQISEQDHELALLLGNPAFLAGDLARQGREKEWSSRQAHDPYLAITAMETNLLLMARIGSDPEVAAQRALEEVARMAAPPRSRIEVTNYGNGYELRVAFLMSALTVQEAGAVTKHHSVESMRQEIQTLSARVIKELYDYCGSRNIQKLSVTCDHAMRRGLVPPEATEWERKQLLENAPVTMGRLYRVSLDQASARTVDDWRKIPARDVIKSMTVEVDGLRKLTIYQSPGWTAESVDPVGKLEF